VEFAVVDVETTGFAPGRDRVVEVAVVRVRRDGQKLGEYSTLINPGRDVGPTFVHGVTATAVVAVSRFDEILGDLNLLVVGDPYTQSTKAKKARDYGTRVLAEMELWRVLGVSLS